MVLNARNFVTSDDALGGSSILRSLRYGRVANTYLSRTNSSNGNRKTFTYSFWMKRTKTGNVNCLNRGNTSVAPWFFFYIENEKFWLWILTSGSSGSPNYWYNVVRDLNAWYHIVLRIDTTQSTAANRARLYINGVEATIQQDNRSTIPQDHDTDINGTSEIRIFNNEAVNQSLEGYLADVYLIDGSSLDPTSFGYTESQTGLWRPKKYTGSYGTNGFHLEFRDNSNTTATTLGKDTSGNGNNWTPNNFSVTAGYNNDSTLDTPTNNFNTFNRLDFNSNADPDAGGLLTNASATGGHYPAFTSIPVRSGKWYLEFDSEADGMLPSIMEIQHDGGSHNTDSTAGNNTSAINKRGYGLLTGDGRTSHNGTYTNYGSRIHGAGGDVGMCAFDADNGKIYWGKNNTWFNSGDPAAGTNPAFSGIDMTRYWVFTFHVYGNSNNVKVKFGSNGFTYTPPAGFKALSSRNLAPEIRPLMDPKNHFNTLLYTGNSSTNQITGLEFKPDLVWVKRRDGSAHHNLVDSVRGTQKHLQPSGTGSEDTETGSNGLTSFNSDGFTVSGTNSGTGRINYSGNTFVAWCWKAGGNANTYNIDGVGYASASAAGLDGGTIDPTGASINTENGLSIITYTANGTNGATIAHGLGRKPAWIIIKCRSNTDKWFIYHHKMDDTAPEDYLVELQDTAGRVDTPNMLNDTAPTDTLVTINNDGAVNSGSRTYVMYCWAEIPGWSKFGRYAGNSSTDDAGGGFVYTGFRPALVIYKKITGTDNWEMHDNVRDTYNPVIRQLFPNTDGNESSSSSVDFLSNGFKQRNSNGNTNEDGHDYVFMAFAEQPGITPFDTFPNAR